MYIYTSVVSGTRRGFGGVVVVVVVVVVGRGRRIRIGTNTGALSVVWKYYRVCHRGIENLRRRVCVCVCVCVN
jgi:hypothetical protein